MKHILKTTAIGGMSMLYCFALEAMEIEHNDQRSGISLEVSVTEEIPIIPSERKVLSFETLYNIDPNTLESLELIDIDTKILKSRPSLPFFSNLKNLELNGCQLDSFEFLLNFPALETLFLYNTPVTSIEKIPNLPALKTIRVVHCGLKSVERFPNFPALEEGHFWFNDISEDTVVELSKRLPTCSFSFFPHKGKPGEHGYEIYKKIENGIVSPFYEELSKRTVEE